MNWSAQHVVISETGHVRTANEDQWFADPARGIYIIADGMGGTLNGGLAAQLVIETLPRLIAQRLDGLTEETSERLSAEVRNCITDLSRRLRSESQGKPGLDGMGSTVVLALLQPTFAVVAHLGDSRAYLLKGGKLKRCTTDHTLVELLIESGEINDSQSAQHPAKGQLTRFVGMPGEALPDVQSLRFDRGDMLLLCSDGLTGELEDAEIERIIRSSPYSLEQKCRQLVTSANASGGRDNITTLLIEHTKAPCQSNGPTYSIQSPSRVTPTGQLEPRNNPST